MANETATSIEDFLASMPEPTPAEMAASFDPGTWAFSTALFKILVKKGIFTVGDLLDMHDEILNAAREFCRAGEVQRVESVDHVAQWLETYASSLGRPDADT